MPPDHPIGRVPSRSEHVRVRGLDYHVRRWGDPAGRPLVLLHGARDCAATFQFMVDALQGGWNILAPDWRGHGLSGRAPQGYWMHDFIADLDLLLRALLPDGAVDLLGHSMGGNVGGLYAAFRPGRIRRFVSLDGLGPPAHRLPVDMYATMVEFLEPSSSSHKGYESLDEVAGRLMKANRRLSHDRAAFLAEASTSRGADNRWRWLFDPAMKRSLPTLHTLEEWGAVWAHVEAPVLWIASSDQRRDAPSFGSDTVAERRRLLPRAEFHRLDGTGHNLHHDRPEDTAALVDAFLRTDADEPVPHPD